MALSNEHRDEGALRGRPLRDERRAALRGGNRAAARQRGSTPSANSSATTCRRALGTTRDRDYANVTRREWQAAHEQITQLEMDHYLQPYQSGVGSQMKNIVVGYDNTEPSQRALERAAELTKALGADLAVVSVAPLAPGGARGGGGVDSVDSPAKHAAELGRAREYLERQAVTAAYQEIVGEPADAIVEFAGQRHADLIIVGTRDHNVLGRLFGQSVSETVSHHAHCDVLAVH